MADIAHSMGAPERAPFSRRTLLGTLAALPLATCCQPAPAAADRRSWELLKQAHTVSTATVAAYNRDHFSPAADRYTAVRDRWPISYNVTADAVAMAALAGVEADYDRTEAEYNRLAEASWTTFDALMATPAPDVAAVRDKLAAMVEREAFEYESAPQLIDGLLSDLHRLAMVRAH